MVKKYCKIHGCVNIIDRSSAKNLCPQHYYKFNRYGNPLYIHPKFRKKVCVVKNCNNISISNNMCSKHSARMYRNGTVHQTKYKLNHSKTCYVVGCYNKYHAKNMCLKHYAKKQENRIKRMGWSIKNSKKILKKNIRYINELTQEFEHIRPSEFMGILSNWSKLIKNRDGYKCQICGDKNKIQSHHIFHKKSYPKLCLNLNNGITLCSLCHYKVHGKTLNS